MIGSCAGICADTAIIGARPRKAHCASPGTDAVSNMIRMLALPDPARRCGLADEPLALRRPYSHRKSVDAGAESLLASPRDQYRSAPRRRNGRWTNGRWIEATELHVPILVRTLLFRALPWQALWRRCSRAEAAPVRVQLHAGVRHAVRQPRVVGEPALTTNNCTPGNGRPQCVQLVGRMRRRIHGHQCHGRFFADVAAKTHRWGRSISPAARSSRSAPLRTHANPPTGRQIVSTPFNPEADTFRSDPITVT